LYVKGILIVIPMRFPWLTLLVPIYRDRLPQRMHNTPRRLLLAAALSFESEWYEMCVRSVVLLIVE